MIMDLERWNKELEDHDLFQPIINDLPNFCETTHETDLENDTLLFCYCMLRTHSNSIHAGLATIMGVVPVTCAQPLACESMLAIPLRSLQGFDLLSKSRKTALQARASFRLVVSSGPGLVLRQMARARRSLLFATPMEDASAAPVSRF